MAIKHVLNYAELQELIRSGTPIIIDFFATWCGPCRAIAPKFEALSSAHPSVNFIKVDVDSQPEISHALGITAMPTFIGYKAGQQVDKIMGANPQALESLIQKIGK